MEGGEEGSGRPTRTSRSTLPLTLGKLREVVNAQKKKNKTSVVLKFEFGDEDRLERELSEFYAQCEVLQVSSYRSTFFRLIALCHGESWTWLKGTEEEKEKLVRHCLDAQAGMGPNEASPSARREAAMALLYLSQGVACECDGSEEVLAMVAANNRLLLQCGAYPVFLHCFVEARNAVNEDRAVPPSDGIVADMDMRLYANLLLMLLQMNSHDSAFCASLVRNDGEQTPLVYVMIESIIHFADSRRHKYPVKKLMLLLWKCFVYGFGGFEKIRQRKSEMLQRFGKTLPDELSLKTGVGQDAALANAIATYKRSRLSMASPQLPPPLREASAVLSRGRYVPPAVLADPLGKDDEETPREQLPAESDVEVLYRALGPSLRKLVIHLLNFLLAVAPTDKKPLQPPPFSLWNEITKAGDGEKTSTADRNRHNEILTKAICGTLLLLLKNFRLNHVMQEAHASHLLVEAKGVLLLLKILNQDASTLLASSALSALELFQVVDRREADNSPVIKSSGAASEVEEMGASTYSWRKFYSLIVILRLLQKLVKGNHHRCQILLKFSTQTILREKTLHIKHPLVRFYSFKLLKNLVKFLGRQWRTANMKLVTDIYINIKPVLMDDWMSTAFVETDRTTEFEMEEKQRRKAVARWQKRHYSACFAEKTLAGALAQALLPWREANADRQRREAGETEGEALLRRELLAVSLDDDWKRNYEEWLEEQVFSRAHVAGLICEGALDMTVQVDSGDVSA